MKRKVVRINIKHRQRHRQRWMLVNVLREIKQAYEASDGSPLAMTMMYEKAIAGLISVGDPSVSNQNPRNAHVA